MDTGPLAMMFTSLGLLALVVLMFLLLACHCMGSGRAASWMRMRSSKEEEKIGLSKHKHKLFHANGYMASIQTGSEFLLSTSGSFKRFDTIDKEDYHQRSQQLSNGGNGCLPPETNTTKTTPLWNLPQADAAIPPQPLRPAPAPNSAGPGSKTVTFSFSNEIRNGGGELPQPLEAPPAAPLRLSTSASIMQTGTAIPRPLAKRQVSLQQVIVSRKPTEENTEQSQQPEDERRVPPILKRRNSSTNPFLCESLDSTATPTTPNPAPATSPPSPPQQDNGNPFAETTNSQPPTNRLFKLSGACPSNPFTRLKGPHLLQKTISEDYLFRKLGAGIHANGNAAISANGNSTWSFGRSLLRQESSISLGLGRRNSSQSSLDSGSLDGGLNLGRGISCDSVNSDSSLFLDQLDQPYTQITGYLCVGLQYDNLTNHGLELIVSVLEAKGLICPFSVDSLDTFVRIYLVPDHPGAMQTKVVNASLTPAYNESFNFWLHKKQMRHSLWFHLYHNGPAHTLIGEAEMEIGEIPKPITTWIPLSDSRKCNARWGELMFSLSYLPTAERLTIVVVKGRNLKMELDTDSDSDDTRLVQHIFVKVYLMNNEKKVLKKRTSLKRKDRCPIFNESMIFSVPPHSLTTVQLRLTVFGVTENGILPLGHVIAGSCAVGKGLRHWHQMLSSLRKPVAMWHVLRRAINQPIFTGGAEAVVAAMQSTLERASAKRNSIV
ncbi:uncharacterized protein Dwil_GK17047 [Drosophila willistoni]|uniref:C2 domain-containing protein n=1 Tax=Drosophila willistoni TaxID=7260 RepID=B4NQ23_DROWI|nr:uncharacterized protein LOC6653141 [Drosophila willistoni]EDW86248.1 uncharacterized protein Dwil_GK17047 [Drosophila willistoni]